MGMIKFDFEKIENGLEIQLEVKECSSQMIVKASQILMEMICKDVLEIKENEQIKLADLEQTYRALSKNHIADKMKCEKPSKEDLVALLDMMKEELLKDDFEIN